MDGASRLQRIGGQDRAPRGNCSWQAGQLLAGWGKAVAGVAGAGEWESDGVR